MPVIRDVKKNVLFLFREFWLICVLQGFATDSSSNWPREWYNSMCTIATRCPLMVSAEKESATASTKSDLLYTPGKLLQSDVNELRTKLCVALELQSPVAGAGATSANTLSPTAGVAGSAFDAISLASGIGTATDGLLNASSFVVIVWFEVL